MVPPPAWIATAAAGAQLQLTTLPGCRLAIGAYPGFRYDGRGGGGVGQLQGPGADGRCPVAFAPSTLVIPPLNSRSTRFLGLPLPPGLEIAIHPERLAGWLEPHSGQVQLHFQARFQCRAGRLYGPPPLWVETHLSTAAWGQGPHRRWGALAGEPLTGDGAARLVGVAAVPPSGDPWLDRFLGLPGEALAVLQCQLRIGSPPATGAGPSPPAPGCRGHWR